MDEENKIVLGKGATSEVISLDDSRVLKLFFEGFWKPAAEYEFHAMKCINPLIENTPQCFEYVNRNGRNGIIYEKIIGETLLSHFNKDPSSIETLTKRMAFEHAAIHDHHTDQLMDQTAKFTAQIDCIKAVIGSRYDRIIEKLRSMKKENRVCHGDYHPDNILLSHDRCYIIDWINCYSGSPAGDIARTYLSILTPYILENTPDHIIQQIDRLKKITSQYYIKEYLRLSPVTLEEINSWMDIIASARLLDSIPGEQDWLLDIIDAHENMIALGA